MILWSIDATLMIPTQGKKQQGLPAPLERPLLLLEIEHKFRKIFVNLLIRSSEGIYP